MSTPTTPRLHPRTRPSTLAVALISLLTALSAAGTAWAQSLSARVEQILRDPKLADSKTGLVIMDAADGTVLASNRADEPLIPASNMKLLTSGAAICVLGAHFTFRTELTYDPAAQGVATSNQPTFTGRVVLRGSGDPTLADPVLLDRSGKSLDELLQGWTDALRNAGVKPGVEIVIDDRVFDRQYVHPTWPVEQLNRWYCAEVSGVNFHTNLLRVFTTPQGEGRPPALKLDPAAPWLELRNRARSISKGSPTVWAQRESGNAITIHGDVRSSSDPVEVALTDMPNFMGRLLSTRMAAAGMAPASVRLASSDEDLSAGTVVHTIITNIADVLRRCNVDSYNLYAEALLKRMGHEVTGAPGSFASGAAVVRMVLAEKLGPDAGQGITVADGSGMSRQNRVSATMLARWLATLAGDPETSAAFLASLPRAGDEGTLRRRFQSKPLVNDVRAKTGFLSGVIAMSGYITESTSGRRLVFCIITNDKPNRVSTTSVREMEERIVKAADDWLEERAGKSARPSVGTR